MARSNSISAQSDADRRLKNPAKMSRVDKSIFSFLVQNIFYNVHKIISRVHDSHAQFPCHNKVCRAKQVLYNYRA